MPEEYKDVLREVRQLDPDESQQYFTELADTMLTYRKVAQGELNQDA